MQKSVSDDMDNIDGTDENTVDNNLNGQTPGKYRNIKVLIFSPTYIVSHFIIFVYQSAV